MLENGRRMQKGIPGCPRVKQSKVLDFFKGLEAKANCYGKLPKWVGELYLEYHRGTYTSMARNKKFNRKSELLYQAAEVFSVASSLLDRVSDLPTADFSGYPQKQLNKGWETILLNQFHDILPGSSIKEVYEDSKQQYLEVLGNGQNILDNSSACIAEKVSLQAPSVVVFNPLGFERNDIAEFDLPDGYENVEVTDSDGSVLPSQIINKGKAIFFATGVSSKGYKAFGIKKAATGSSAFIDSAIHDTCKTIYTKDISKEGCDVQETPGLYLANKFFNILFDESMNITSLYDVLNNREVLKPGERANVLQAFEDKPHNHDAWDINIYYQEKMWEVTDVDSIELIEAGNVRSTVRVVRRFCDSMILQDISIFNNVPRIDFKTTIDWKETQVLLKAAFPVDIHSEKATYEIQYGNVERPTHWNTSWDQAKFEVCAHKWADLSEDDYGVSLLNDCKYGHDIKDGVMRLTLLKSAKSPNVDADRELHEFTYSLFPHKGSFKEAGTVAMAYALNCPMFTRVENPHAGSLPAEFSLASVDMENVIIEVVKKGEDSNDIIIRLYECYNRRSSVRLTFGAGITNVRECDLLENNLNELPHDGDSFTFDIRPYEIKTFKLTASMA